MKLKKAFKKEPPTTEPKLYFNNLASGKQQLVPSLVYHSAPFPETMKLTKSINMYMHLSGTALPIRTG